uniref:IRK-interacting protein n=1 Tax=Kalanchoe fedtschenkoi TaxID=63787 RepID=A0A7N0ZYV6_KALFE
MPPPPPSSASPGYFKSPSHSHCQSPPRGSHLYPSLKFTPIRESDELGEGDEESIGVGSTPAHHATPLHHSAKSASTSTKQSTGKRSESKSSATTGDEEGGVSCTKCRPSPREKISVVPLDNNSKHSLTSSMASPNLIFKSICSSLSRKSSRMTETSSPSPSPSPYADAREEQWRIALTELSQKLVHTTRKRDEAALEVSRLKHAMAELEKKLSKLEIYCHSLKSNLELCHNNVSSNNVNSNDVRSSPARQKIESTKQAENQIELIHQEKVVESFLLAVSQSRLNVRALAKALTLQLRQTTTNLNDKITTLLQPYDVKLSTISRNPKNFLHYLEALLNRAFFENFESVGFEKNSPNHILNPLDRCESNLASYTVLHQLTWDEVLDKGTKHFSESFSWFCDRKMSEVVKMLGWSRAWPEPLLQAFFGASKSVWLVHLLANSVHPSLPLFRIESDSKFDPVYMADSGADRARNLFPSVVRVMVAPGFYVFGNVVKCKVLCRYAAEPIPDAN